MKLEINPYDRTSILNARKQIEQYKEKLKTFEREMLTRLASLGATRVEATYSSFETFEPFDFEVTFDVLEKTAVITARGEKIAFIEFGAGKYYNTMQGQYPKPLPSGIVGIGQYGKGHGKRDAWGYYENGDKSKLVITHGNPPAKAFWEAELEIKEKVGEIAREVFK